MRRILIQPLLFLFVIVVFSCNSKENQKINNLVKRPFVVLPSQITKGAEYEAKVYLAYIDTSAQNLKYKVNGNYLPIEHGGGIYKFTPKNVSEIRKLGQIEYQNGDSIEIYPFHITSQVVYPCGVLSAIMNNTLFKNFNNRLDLFYTGIKRENLILEAKNAII